MLAQVDILFNVAVIYLVMVVIVHVGFAGSIAADAGALREDGSGPAHRRPAALDPRHPGRRGSSLPSSTGSCTTRR